MRGTQAVCRSEGWARVPLRLLAATAVLGVPGWQLAFLWAAFENWGGRAKAQRVPARAPSARARRSTPARWVHPPACLKVSVAPLRASGGCLHADPWLHPSVWVAALVLQLLRPAWLDARLMPQELGSPPCGRAGLPDTEVGAGLTSSLSYLRMRPSPVALFRGISWPVYTALPALQG